MQKNLSLGFFVVLVVITLLGTSCAAPAAPAPAAPAPAATAAPAAPAAPAATAVPAASQAPAGGVSGKQFDGVALNALIVSQPAHLQCAEMVAKEFEETTGAKVNISSQGYATMRDSLMTAFMGKTGAYDLASVAYQWTGEFADPGFLLPLDDYLKDDPKALDDFIPRSKDLYGQWQGKQVALPYHGEAMLLFYRPDVLKKNNLEVPKTWDEFDSVAKALTKDGMYGTAIMGLREQDMTMWSNRYWGLGGKSLDIDENGQVKLDRDKAIDALQRLKSETMDYSPPGALNFGLPESAAAFVQGKAAMIEMWPSFVGPMTLDPAATAKEVFGNVAVAQVPGGIMHSGGWGLGVAADSKNKDAAVAFARLMTSPKYDLECFLKTGKGPTRQSTFAQLKEQKDLQQYWLPEMGVAMANAMPRSRAPQAGEINDMFDEVVSRYLAGELTAEQAVDEMQARLDKTLKK